MANVEISALEVLVLKKLVLVNAALAKALSDPMAAQEQLTMTKAVNDFVLRADLAVKSERVDNQQSQPRSE